MKLLLILVALLIHFESCLQIDTTQNINEVKVVDYVDILELKSWRSIYFNQEDIELLAPIDLGDLLNRTIGANVKSYGGLGGLKTVSFRGLGANHTSIVVDGFAIKNNQTGQVNLGTIQADNIVSVADQKYSSSIMIPILAHVQGAMFSMTTFENSFSNKKVSVRNSNTIGSFGQEKVYLGAKYSSKKLYVSLFGNYTQAEGRYNYSLENGNIQIDDKRINNDYLQLNIGTGIGFKVKNVRIRLFGATKRSMQGLPGAVIFYNQTQDSRLNLIEYKVGADAVLNYKKFIYRIYGSFNNDLLNYHDPTYLNNQGFIDDRFTNNSFDFGFKSRVKLNESISLHYGLEWDRSELIANNDKVGEPVRDHLVGLLGVSLHYKKIRVNLDPSVQYLIDRNTKYNRQFEKLVFTPIMNFEYSIKKNLKIDLDLKRTFRMPSFNDMYYSGIGNEDLKPEKATQVKIGTDYLVKNRNTSFSLQVNVYNNFIDDKIVAIPTQNLFVWSMQNLGKVNVFGCEFLSRIEYSMNSSSSLSLELGYTYQMARDVTSKESILYNSQIPYVPEHSVNGDLTIRLADFTLRFSNQLISSRYALNENILMNLVDGFLVSDLILKYSRKIKNHRVSLLAGVKNVFNQSYQVVRYYVMPQRNYFISLKYAFN